MDIPKKFPVLGIAEDGDIVLFTDLGKTSPVNSAGLLKGVCVAATPARAHAIGQYMKDWFPQCFELYEGTVTIGPFKPE
jgi:hypothetical protein